MNVLEKISFTASHLTSVQREQDALLDSFSEGAKDWKAVTSMLVGGGVYKLSKYALLNKLPFLGKAFASGLALGFEVSGYRAMSQVLEGEGLSASRVFEKRGWWNDCVNFGLLKSLGKVTQGSNFVLSNLVPSFGMVAGHHLAYALHLAAKPEGSLTEQFAHAFITDFQMRGSFGLLHLVAPQLSVVDHLIDLETQLCEQNLKGVEGFSLMNLRAASPIGFMKSHSPTFEYDPSGRSLKDHLRRIGESKSVEEVKALLGILSTHITEVDALDRIKAKVSEKISLLDQEKRLRPLLLEMADLDEQVLERRLKSITDPGDLNRLQKMLADKHHVDKAGDGKGAVYSKLNAAILKRLDNLKLAMLPKLIVPGKVIQAASKGADIALYRLLFGGPRDCVVIEYRFSGGSEDPKIWRVVKTDFATEHVRIDGKRIAAEEDWLNAKREESDPQVEAWSDGVLKDGSRLLVDQKKYKIVLATQDLQIVETSIARPEYFQMQQGDESASLRIPPGDGAGFTMRLKRKSFERFAIPDEVLETIDPEGHCSLTWREGAWFLVNPKGLQGNVYAGEAREAGTFVETEYPLSNRSVISLGSLVFEVSIDNKGNITFVLPDSDLVPRGTMIPPAPTVKLISVTVGDSNRYLTANVASGNLSKFKISRQMFPSNVDTDTVKDDNHCEVRFYNGKWQVLANPQGDTFVQGKQPPRSLDVFEGLVREIKVQNGPRDLENGGFLRVGNVRLRVEISADGLKLVPVLPAPGRN